MHTAEWTKSGKHYHHSSSMETHEAKGIQASGRLGGLKQDISRIQIFESQDEIMRITAQLSPHSGVSLAPLASAFTTCKVVLGPYIPGFLTQVSQLWAAMVLQSLPICVGCLKTNIQQPPYRSGTRHPLLSPSHPEELGPKVLWGLDL